MTNTKMPKRKCNKCGKTTTLKYNKPYPSYSWKCPKCKTIHNTRIK
jgi:phage FluMu protein Com